MKNQFEMRGDVTAIFLLRKDGSVIETIIDTCDLERVMEFTNTWSACWDPSIQSFYVRGHSSSVNGKRHTVHLHRWIKEPPSMFVVDHINGDTLNNRGNNLRTILQRENAQNRKLDKTNKSGIRGVSWFPQKQKWRAEISINGKKTHLGYFDSKHEAKNVSDQARRKHMPYANRAVE